MKRVLVVSPSFPPTTAADLHRVRMSLPHFAAFGWTPHVLAIDPASHGGLVEPELVTTLPESLAVTRTGALPEAMTRLFGVGNPGLRGLGHLYAAGARIIARESIDLVFFSTTMFPVMALGRLWKARFGTPYVVDIQDPWKTDYRGAGRAMGIKASLARTMHGLLEPFAMRQVDGVVSVSRAYIETLQRRYAWLSDDRCAVIPFGTDAADFTAARAIKNWQNPFFNVGDGCIHAVAVGRGGLDMRPAADVLFAAVRLFQDRGLAFAPLHFSFIGTDYASGKTQQTIAPAAETAGVSSMVTESPERVPYLHALRLLGDGHLTVILGSDDAQYSPSKVYPYLLAGKPFIAVLHADSPVVPLLREAGTGVVATFRAGEDSLLVAARLADGLTRLLACPPADARVAPEILAPVSARELTRRQCTVFDLVMRRQGTEGLACAG
jgi:hypothetical protein